MRLLLALALTAVLAGTAYAQGSCFCTTNCGAGVCQTICTGNCGGR
jgi:hypothetical protein